MWCVTVFVTASDVTTLVGHAFYDHKEHEITLVCHVLYGHQGYVISDSVCDLNEDDIIVVCDTVHDHKEHSVTQVCHALCDTT